MEPLRRRFFETLLAVVLACSSCAGFAAEPSPPDFDPALHSGTPWSGSIYDDVGPDMDPERVGENFDFEIDSACREFPRWSLQAEALLLWRGDDALADWTADSGESVNRGLGTGPRVVLALQVSPQSSWQVEYFSMLGMVDKAQGRLDHYTFIPPVFGPNDYLIDITQSWGLVRSQVVSAIRYESELHNVELNYYRTWNEFSILAGFRFLRLTEKLEERYWQELWGQQTENNLFGGQIGGRWRRSREQLFWEVTGKAGIYGNDAQQTFGFQPYLRDIVYGPARHQGDIAFVGDLNASLGWRLTPVWSVRGGYNAIWLTGVAIAPEQDFSLASDRVNTSGGVFLHGLNVGLEANW